MYVIKLQFLNEAEAANTGEPLIEILKAETEESARLTIKQVLDFFPYAGYALFIGYEMMDHKPFDNVAFNKAYYG